MSDLEILNQIGSALLADMKAQVPVVTGETANSMEYSVEGLSISIIGNKSIGALQDGRKPTSGNGSASESLHDKILAWATAKSLTPKIIKEGQSAEKAFESMVWAMTKSIHAKGTLLYQQGGGVDLFASVITESRLNSIADVFFDSKKLAIESSIIKQFKPFSK